MANRIPPVQKVLWPDYLDKLEWKAAVKTGVTAAISFYLGVEFSRLFNRPDTLVSGLWCILTSIVVIQPHVGGTYKAAMIRFLGILVGSILGAVFTSWFGSSPIPLGVSVAITVTICALLNLSDSFRIAAMSVAVVMVLWGMNPLTSPWTFALYRFLDSCLGIAIAVIVTHTLWPSQATSTTQGNLARILKLISELYLYGTELQAPREHLDKTSQEDMEELQALIHDNKNMMGESKLELMIKRDGLENWKLMMQACEALTEEISILSSINKHNISLILDDSLAKNLEALIDRTEASLNHLSKQLEKNMVLPSPAGQPLQTSLKALQEDLLRFRSTKTTRRFELQDVEGFFVYFYTIVQVAEQIPRLEETVKKQLVQSI